MSAVKVNDRVFDEMAEKNPKRAYSLDRDRFWEWMKVKHPGVSREAMYCYLGGIDEDQ